MDAIIATHSRDRKVAAWLEDTAEALAEIGEFDLAIDWARQAAWFDLGHQAAKASGYWCELLAEHRPDEELPARLEVFRRWPTSSNASALHKRAGASWPTYADEVMATLERRPREAVSFALYGLDDLTLAWDLAHSLTLDDSGLWQELAKRYEKVDPLAVLPIHTRGGARRSRARRRRLLPLRGPPARPDAQARVRQPGGRRGGRTDRRSARDPPTPSPPATGVRQGWAAVVGSPLVSRLVPSDLAVRAGRSRPGPHPDPRLVLTVA